MDIFFLNLVVIFKESKKSWLSKDYTNFIRNVSNPGSLDSKVCMNLNGLKKNIGNNQFLFSIWICSNAEMSFVKYMHIYVWVSE